MPALTKEELSELNPEKVYNIPTVLHQELWSSIDPTLATVLNAPLRIPFDTSIRTKLGGVKNKKGIYIFMVEPDFPFVPKVNYLLYVGRVIGRNTFFKRFHDYVSSIGNKNKRRNLQLLTNLWPGKTWVYFYELALPDPRISAIEKNLFDNIIPPLNNQFRSKRATNARSIYN
jgi:hypothetical protein